MQDEYALHNASKLILKKVIRNPACGDGVIKPRKVLQSSIQSQKLGEKSQADPITGFPMEFLPNHMVIWLLSATW